jgi:hypothetical protein
VVRTCLHVLVFRATLSWYACHLFLVAKDEQGMTEVVVDFFRSLLVGTHGWHFVTHFLTETFLHFTSFTPLIGGKDVLIHDILECTRESPTSTIGLWRSPVIFRSTRQIILIVQVGGLTRTG